MYDVIDPNETDELPKMKSIAGRPTIPEIGLELQRLVSTYHIINDGGLSLSPVVIDGVLVLITI
jgi:hypothetical protein